MTLLSAMILGAWLHIMRQNMPLLIKGILTLVAVRAIVLLMIKAN